MQSCACTETDPPASRHFIISVIPQRRSHTLSLLGRRRARPGEHARCSGGALIHINAHPTHRVHILVCPPFVAGQKAGSLSPSGLLLMLGAVVDQLARQNLVAGSKELAGRSRIKAEVIRRTRPDVRTSTTRLASDRMVKVEKLACCHTSRSRLLLAMEEPESNRNVERLRKCARYFRALAAVPETRATAARAELVHIAGQFEALARQRTASRANRLAG